MNPAPGWWCRRRPGVRSHQMSNPFYSLVPFAIAAVAIVLVFGLVNMLRGGSPHLSQKLMRLRVLLQAIALVIIMLAIWMMGR
jgi:hypothetical protein